MPVKLTLAQLAVLIRYQWQAAWFATRATAAEKALLSGTDWDALAELLADLRLYHHRRVSPAYAQNMHARLLAACADEETAQTLLGYASTL